MRLKQSVIFFTILAAVLLALYAPLFVADPLISQDDQRLVQPLTSVSGVSDYLALVRSGQIMDLQPLRDLSFWIDLQISRGLAFPIFRPVNLGLWFSALFIFFFGLRRIKIPISLAFASVAMIAVHPLAMNSVAWVAARKHLLACVMILAASILSLKRPVTALSLYALSLLAQPIFLIWPAWSFLLDSYLKLRRPLIWGIGAFLATTAASLNYSYYKGAYLSQNGGQSKFVDVPSVSYSLQAVGRGFLQILLPLNLKLYYYAADDVINWVGVGALALTLLAFTSVKPIRRAEFALAFLFFLLPLLPILFSQTNIFLSDTYLLGGLFAFATTLALLANLKPKVGILILYILAVAYSALSLLNVGAWKSTAAYCARMAEVAPSEQSLSCHGMFLIDDGHYAQALMAAKKLGKSSPGAADITARIALEDGALDFEQRLKLLREIENPTPRSLYFSGLTYARHFKFEEADRAFQAARKDPQAFAFAFRADLEDFLADQFMVCSNLRKPDCENYSRSARALNLGRPWNEERYQARIRSWMK